MLCLTDEPVDGARANTTCVVDAHIFIPPPYATRLGKSPPTHPSHTPHIPLTRLSQPSHNPLAPLTHPSHTPRTPLSQPSHTPHTPLAPLTHPSHTPRTPLSQPSHTPHTPLAPLLHASLGVLCPYSDIFYHANDSNPLTLLVLSNVKCHNVFYGSSLNSSKLYKAALC